MTLCTAPRHGEDEAETEPHAHLCKPCRTGLLTDLRRLPRLHAELDHVPARGDGDGSGLPFSEPASECRDQIRHDLTYWARHITQLRGLDAPPVQGSGWSDHPVHAMAGWLAGQVTWCSFRDWAPDMAGAIQADRARALALLDPWVTKRFDIPGADGICLVCEDSEPAGCGECGRNFAEAVIGLHRQPIEPGHFRLHCVHPSAVRLTMDRQGKWVPRVSVTVYASDGDRRRSFIGCPGCGQVWEPEQWLSYGRRVVQRREAMAS